MSIAACIISDRFGSFPLLARLASSQVFQVTATGRAIVDLPRRSLGGTCLGGRKYALILSSLIVWAPVPATLPWCAHPCCGCRRRKATGDSRDCGPVCPSSADGPLPLERQLHIAIYTHAQKSQVIGRSPQSRHRKHGLRFSRQGLSLTCRWTHESRSYYHDRGRYCARELGPGEKCRQLDPVGCAGGDDRAPSRTPENGDISSPGGDPRLWIRVML